MDLTRSSRITLISEIARRLGTEEWTLIDLALDQFDFPTTDEWEGEKSEYVVEMIKSGEDDVLVDLGRHVGYEASSSRPQLEPKFWRKGCFRLFVSHLSDHAEYAGELQKEFFRFGVSCFVAHEDIEPTKEWLGEIETALATCDAMLGLVSPGFHASEWTDQELGYAMGRQLLVATASFGTDPRGFVGKFQALKAGRKSAKVLAGELYRVLRDHRQTRERISKAVVECFRRSNSFDRAKKNMALIEELSYWDPSLSADARSAVQSNRQIGEAFGVRQRLETFSAKMGRSGSTA